jgi:poly-gamma-glutamate synthesis protein (capsule biosynthesis protein)
MNQRLLAGQLAEAGVDAIIGHHPHVTQPVDTIGNTIVCYSLGNFVFDQHPPQTRQCMMVRLNIKAGTSITMDVIPTRIEGCRPIPTANYIYK